MTPEQFWRVAEKFTISDGCWEWTGCKSSDGYGMVHEPCIKKMRGAHRVVYEQLREPIPEGKYLDHVCRNHGCVNPDHLEVVSFRENILRGVGPTALNSAKEKCIRGHTFDIIRADGGRGCRECKIAKAAEYRERHRAELRERQRSRYWRDPKAARAKASKNTKAHYQRHRDEILAKARAKYWEAKP